MRKSIRETAACIILLVAISLSCTSKTQQKQSDSPQVQDLQAHEMDGKGSAVLIPDHPVKAAEWGSWKLLFFPGDEGIDTGGGILFQVSPFWYWSMPQTHDPEGAGYTSVSTTSKEVKFDITEGDFHYLLIVLEEGRLTAQDTVTIIYGDTINGTFPYALSRVDSYAERDEEFLIKVDGNGDSFYTPIENSPTVDIHPREATNLLFYAPSIVTVGEQFNCRVSALDGFGNRDVNFEGAVSFPSSDKALELPAVKRFEAADSGSVEIPASCHRPGTYRIEVQSTDGTMTALSNPVFCSSSSPEYLLYWGDLQGHSELGDGSGQPDEYYAYARDVSRLDVASLTEHDAHGFFPLDENPDLWNLIRETTEAYYSPGRFVTFLAYEWTSWTYGHRHILFPGKEGEVFSFRDSTSDTPEELWELIRPYGAIAIPHHPGGGPIGTDWDHHDDTTEPLVEISSVHGNSDFYGCPGQIYRPQKSGFVQNALERGYRLGILGSGDTHDGHPGTRSAGYPWMGVAGIWAKELSREGIWEALLAKRVYATSGARILLEFEVNGHRMGESFELGAQTEGSISLHAVGTAEIDYVEVLEDDRVLFRDEIGSLEAGFSHPHRLEPGSYYRARLMQTDGEMAWSSPIWCTNR
ncbi:MAG: CehA/McbA family metallohydrolase [Candidatus Glassbacteria bacterium]